jgi:hypothetical protein
MSIPYFAGLSDPPTPEQHPLNPSPFWRDGKHVIEYGCFYCGLFWSTSSELRLHLEEVHPEVEILPGDVDITSFVSSLPKPHTVTAKWWMRPLCWLTGKPTSWTDYR